MRKQIFVIPISVVVTILYSKLFIALIISIVLKVQSLTVLSSNIRLKHNPSLSLLCMHQRVKTESPLLSCFLGSGPEKCESKEIRTLRKTISWTEDKKSLVFKLKNKTRLVGPFLFFRKTEKGRGYPLYILYD